MGVSVYQIVTDRIIAELEKGIIPWERPWTGVRDGAYSRTTGKPYSLLNQLLLGRPNEYLTYRQALAAGGQVRKSEKGSISTAMPPVTAKYIAERANMLPHAVLSMDLEDALLLQRDRQIRKVKRYKQEEHPEIADYVSREDGEEESLVDILDSFELSDDGTLF